MSRPLSLLIAAAAVAAAPLPALAQTWPSTATAAAPQMRAQPRVSLKAPRQATLDRPALGLARNTNASLILTPSDQGESLDVELRPKAEWSDDQGLRVGPTRIGYKSRF